jgi:hypothetical protein
MAELKLFMTEYNIKGRESVPAERRLFQKHHCGSTGIVLNKTELSILLETIKIMPRFCTTKRRTVLKKKFQHSQELIKNLELSQKLATRACRKFASNVTIETDSGFETDLNATEIITEETLQRLTEILHVPKTHIYGMKYFSKHSKKTKAEFYCNKKLIPLLVKSLQANFEIL